MRPPAMPDLEKTSPAPEKVQAAYRLVGRYCAVIEEGSGLAPDGFLKPPMSEKSLPAAKYNLKVAMLNL